MKNILIVVDMQNDFIDGVLGNEYTKTLIDPMIKLVSEFEGDIIFTRDTHFSGYGDTIEGKNIPLHCSLSTTGWRVNKALLDAAYNNTKARVREINKGSFAHSDWIECLKNNDIELYNVDGSNYQYKDVYLVGTCTDICVVSNALAIRSQMMNNPVKVIADLCSGTSKENHEAALKVMKSCLIETVNYEDVKPTK